MHVHVVPRGEDHQGQAGVVVLGRGAGPAAPWAFRGSSAHGSPGSLVPAVADRLRRQPARRDIPGLDATDVAHLDLANTRARQQRRQDRAHPARTSHLDAKGTAGGQ